MLDRPRPGGPLGASRENPAFAGFFILFYFLDAQIIAHTTKTLISSIIRGRQIQIDLDGLDLLHEGQRSHLSDPESGGRACLRR